MNKDSVTLLSQMLSNSDRPVFFTGAGISTESGIPDFRGPSGFWKANQPINFNDFLESEPMRRLSWERNIALTEKLVTLQPNIGHKKIAEFLQQKTNGHLITQNIDNLHQVSGLDAHRITEIHGNATYASSLSCRKYFPLTYIHEPLKTEDKIQDCDSCGGLIKTATISFGQAMPEKAMIEAQKKVLACDLFISIGSSLQVFPAAKFPEMAKNKGAKLVIINREPTSFDAIADMVIHGEIGEAFSQLKFEL